MFIARLPLSNDVLQTGFPERDKTPFEVAARNMPPPPLFVSSRPITGAAEFTVVTKAAAQPSCESTNVPLT